MLVNIFKIIVGLFGFFGFIRCDY